MKRTCVPDGANWPLTHSQSWLWTRQCLHTSLPLLLNSRKPSTMWWTTSERVPRRLRPRFSSPCLCVLSKPTRWGHQADAAYVSFLTCSLTGCSFLSWKFPLFQTWILRVSVRAEQGRALAASVPQDVAYSPRPNNRKGQLGLTLELQLWCLDWFFLTPRLPPPSLLFCTPGQPRPAPPHSTLPGIVLSLDLWDLLKEMCNTGISVHFVSLSQCDCET